jgi:hypothetical protein
MFRLAQRFEGPAVADVPAAVEAELSRLRLAGRIRRGASVAVTAGSRGIRDIVAVLRAVVAHLRAIGAAPFVVPAMGSHGGGTAEGQVRLLAHYGVTPESVGAEIRASMETVVLGRTEDGIPVHFDKIASQADHVVVVGRVKPHTDFHNNIESGLMKMMMIGLGKHEGAKIAHRAIQDLTFDRIVRTVGRTVLAKAPILCGVAILENGYDRTAHIEAVEAAGFETREPALLDMARKLLPGLPFAKVDLLMVDEIGKNISGTGMDTNVINRKPSFTYPAPVIKKIYVRGLTHATSGNASGIGLADVTTRRLVDSADWPQTYINSRTSGWLRSASVPMTVDCDRTALDVILRTVGLVEPENARVVRIANTLELAEIEASEAYLPELAGRAELTRLTDPAEMAFDAEGNLPPVLRGRH